MGDSQVSEGGKTGDSEGWRHYQLYDERTLWIMMWDMFAAAAAMVEAKEKGIRGSAYRE